MDIKKETYERWLSEDFLLNEIERTPDQQERVEKLYDYLMLLKEYEEEIDEE